jgi:hypothetical protein
MVELTTPAHVAHCAQVQDSPKASCDRQYERIPSFLVHGARRHQHVSTIRQTVEAKGSRAIGADGSTRAFEAKREIGDRRPLRTIHHCTLYPSTHDRTRPLGF